VRLFVSWLSLRKVSPSLSLSHFIFFVLVGQQRRRLSGYWSSLQLYSWFRWTHFAVPFWILFSWFLLRHIPIPISASNSTIYTCSPEFLYEWIQCQQGVLTFDSIPIFWFTMTHEPLCKMGKHYHDSRIQHLWTSRKCMSLWMGCVLSAGAADNGFKKGLIKVIWIEWSQVRRSLMINV